MIAAGDNPRPITATDTLIRKETLRCLVGGSANDEVSRTGHDFVMTVGADDFERQRIIVGHWEFLIDDNLTEGDAIGHEPDWIRFDLILFDMTADGVGAGKYPAPSLSAAVGNLIWTWTLVMSGTASTGSRVSDHAPDIAAPSVQSNTSLRFSHREGKDAFDHCRVGYAPLDLKPSDRELPMATSAELQALRVKAIEMGLTSLTTA